ncbi:unnamed protein product [Cladocopium goreaui]|uniref:Uncharacterized protein n=1 Tax=Cladocopium goreaui TaxID=2562237 RepID=A0A9P1BT78_9DINO|nr:unnamed protein product [Cladocopium goreaui]
MAPKPKAVRKGTLKRPASKLSPKSHDARVDVATLSAEKFSLTDFIRATWNLNGLAPSSTCKRALTVSSCCTGVNSFGYVLKKMVHCLGQQVKLKDLFGSECDKACQAFLLRNNRAPRCLFEDASDVSTCKQAACAVHARMCVVPSSVAGGEDDLYQSSFVCHWNSIQNPKRFQHDVTQIAQPTWEATRADIAARRPLYALLENVTGLQRDPELAAGGGNGEPALNHCLQQLREIPGYTVHSCEATAHPLPADRNRCLIFLSRSEQHPAEVLFQEFESLQSSVKLNMRRHHLDTCLVAHASATSQQEGGSNPLETTASDDAQDAAAYFQYFSSGLEKAFKKGRLPPGFKVVPREERPSCKHIALQKKSAWCRAQADVYFFIGQFLAQQEQVEDSRSMVADISQSADRGKLCLRGTLPTCTTSSTLYHYRLERFISAPELFVAHGYPGQTCWEGLSEGDQRRIVGNLMSSTTLVLALCPFLKALGALRSSA